MTRAKIEQIVAVPRGDAGVAVIAVDECGQAWANYTNNQAGGQGSWNEWYKLPQLPDGSYDPLAQMK